MKTYILQLSNPAQNIEEYKIFDSERYIKCKANDIDEVLSKFDKWDKNNDWKILKINDTSLQPSAWFKMLNEIDEYIR